MSEFGESITQTKKVSITQFADTIYDEYSKAKMLYVFFDTSVKEFVTLNSIGKEKVHSTSAYDGKNYYQNYIYYAPIGIKINSLSEKTIPYEKLSAMFECNRLYIGFNPNATIQLKKGCAQYMAIANETKMYKNSHIYNYIVKSISLDASQEVKEGFKKLVDARLKFTANNDEIFEAAHMKAFADEDEIVF